MHNTLGVSPKNSDDRDRAGAAHDLLAVAAKEAGRGRDLRFIERTLTEDPALTG